MGVYLAAAGRCKALDVASKDVEVQFHQEAGDLDASVISRNFPLTADDGVTSMLSNCNHHELQLLDLTMFSSQPGTQNQGFGRIGTRIE